MFKTTTTWYFVLIPIITIGLIAFMFALEPKIIIPSIIGIVVFTTIIILFYRSMMKKGEEHQRKITMRNGKVSSVLVVVMLIAFFVAGASYHDVSLTEFIGLWFNL